ncbi:hypothetical protein CLOBOL_05400 [Enterocloster bolteae ATCC BAA-613]|jgi:hypothetical protein|uniref:Uncharacterized protein n=1 Tax=Enterocloster bolteae (strain ATCC BAA-613 / DSM 15670 / CCUG 46953 / JCM 12243 / WAL 16351) TaxID=411902 RepID=A8RZF0_ENTBW|nr:hypothetical protein CLOBOL_05400 [Enterocloster bolteae ATCC BAA-613]
MKQRRRQRTGLCFFFFRKNLENECVIFYTVRQQMDGMEKNT